MPLAIPEGYAHVGIQIRHQQDPEPWYVTHGVSTSAMGGDVEGVGTKALLAFCNAWLPAMSNLVTVTGAEVVYGMADGEPLRTFVAALDEFPGTVTGGFLPQNCACLVRKYTIYGGRRQRGRCFVPGTLPGAAVSAGGLMVPSLVDTLQTAATAWFDALESGVGDPPEDMPMFLLHSDGISSLPAPTPISSLAVDNIISTQRRRLR